MTGMTSVTRMTGMTWVARITRMTSNWGEDDDWGDLDD